MFMGGDPVVMGFASRVRAIHKLSMKKQRRRSRQSRQREVAMPLDLHAIQGGAHLYEGICIAGRTSTQRRRRLVCGPDPEGVTPVAVDVGKHITFLEQAPHALGGAVPPSRLRAGLPCGHPRRSLRLC